MISFDWPSEGSLFSYQVDKANADFAVRQLRKLLEVLAETSATGINIIGHSAGAPIVIEALRQLSLIYYDLDDDEACRSKIGRVVLAAPDMDLESALSARSTAPDASRSASRCTHRVPTRLRFSGNIFRDVRLGRSIGKLDEGEHATIIANDVAVDRRDGRAEATSSFIGHSYYHQNPWVSSDVMLFLRLGATAEERGSSATWRPGSWRSPTTTRSDCRRSRGSFGRKSVPRGVIRARTDSGARRRAVLHFEHRIGSPGLSEPLHG